MTHPTPEQIEAEALKDAIEFLAIGPKATFISFSDEEQSSITGEPTAQAYRRHMQTITTALAENNRLKAEVERWREALTPSAWTKAYHIAEYNIELVQINYEGDEVCWKHPVPWGTVKQIMRRIKESVETALAPLPEPPENDK